MYKLILLRHGQSEWNKKNFFNGWADTNLSSEGKKEARDAGKLLKKRKISFDLVFTSALKRTEQTSRFCLNAMNLGKIKKIKSWKLNERHYGDLTGKNRDNVLKEFGKKQFLAWRRSYATRPPIMDVENKYYKAMKKNKSFKGVKVPRTESLKDVYHRVIPYWQKEIAPQIKKGKKVAIFAHGNSLRALVKYLDKISDTNISKLEIPVGKPLVYELDKNLKPIRSYYLK